MSIRSGKSVSTERKGRRGAGGRSGCRREVCLQGQCASWLLSGALCFKEAAHSSEVSSLPAKIGWALHLHGESVEMQRGTHTTTMSSHRQNWARSVRVTALRWLSLIIYFSSLYSCFSHTTHPSHSLPSLPPPPDPLPLHSPSEKSRSPHDGRLSITRGSKTRHIPSYPGCQGNQVGRVGQVSRPRVSPNIEKSDWT